MKFGKKNIVILISLLTVLFVFLAILANSFMNKDSKLNFLSYKFFIASADETESNTNKGDLVIVKQIENSEIKNDDNIVYKLDNDIVIKKVENISNNDGKTNLTFYGVNGVSNNNDINIMGKMINKIAGVGNLAMLIQTPTGTILLLSMLICIILIVKKIYNRNSLDETLDESDNNDNNDSSKSTENVIESINNASEIDGKEVH